MKKLIELKGVSRTYGNGDQTRTVLKNVDLRNYSLDIPNEPQIDISIEPLQCLCAQSILC